MLLPKKGTLFREKRMLLPKKGTLFPICYGVYCCWAFF